jgi:hypothetical protein
MGDTNSGAPLLSMNLNPQGRYTWLEDKLERLQARTNFCEAANQRLRNNNAVLREENERMRLQLPNRAQHRSAPPPSQTLVDHQVVEIRRLQAELQQAQQFNRGFTKQLEDAKQEVKNAKETLVHERGEFTRELKLFWADIAKRDSENLGLKMQLQQLRRELREKSNSATVLQQEVDKVRREKEECENFLKCALAELDIEREEHGRTEEELQDASQDLRQERDDHDETSAKLETTNGDLEREEKRHVEAKFELQKCQEKLNITRYVVEFATKMRLRWFCSYPINRGNRYEIINRGNRAAHDANIIVDLALLSLGKIDDSYRYWLQSVYGIGLDPYICDYSKLKELKAKSRSTELINLKASMSETLKQNKPSATKFRELLNHIDVIRKRIAERHGSEEESEKAFEDDGSVMWVIKDMRAIVDKRDRE